MGVLLDTHIGRAPLAPTNKARKSDGRGNPPGCPIPGGSASRPYLPQRFTLLDTLQESFSFESQGLRPCIPEAENFI